VKAVYGVWRRELQIMLRAPILYIVGGVFLVVQGIAFAGLVNALSDPRRPALLGALLEGQLAGTLLTWLLQLVVLTLLGMRAIADDKRSGAWELLLTAPVGEGAAVVGKWLAATTVYALLWLPTLAYLGLVAAFRTDGGGWDPGSIACGYAGAIALGAALLAWAIAASAATSTTLAAGGLGFALVIGLFLVGELPAVWPGLGADHPRIAHALSAVSLREQLIGFARGELALSRVVFVAALAVVGLSLAIALACAGRRRTRELRIRFAATVLFAAAGALGLVLALRHPLALDVSAHRRNSLDPQTETLVAQLPAQATVTIVEPTLGALDSLYDEVGRVADRMSAIGPVEVRRVDPARVPGGLDAAARIAGIEARDLAANGSVVVELGGKRRVLDVMQLATIDVGTGSVDITALAIERSLAGALAQLAQPAPVTVCATSGHGELPFEPAPDRRDWSMVAERLRADGMTVEDISDGPVPARCNAVIVAGPAQPLPTGEAVFLQGFLASGSGGLVVAASARRRSDGTLPVTGLEGLLAAQGLGLPAAVAIDRSLSVIPELPGALLVFDGYADHPVNAGFPRTRATLWFPPRVVVTAGEARALVSATAGSWGERDLTQVPATMDEDDLAGPAILAAVGHRTIAIGSAESFATATLAGGPSAADLWLAQAVRFVAGIPMRAPAIATRAADRVRLVMSTAERRAVIALSTAGIPLAWIVVGGALLWWRRRRSG
jgi:ABC-2 type transport system permease protein